MSSAHTSLGAYATDALDGAEALDVEAHLAECDVCRREFEEFSETAAELSRLVAATPPSELRGSVLRTIAQVRPLPPETDAETSNQFSTGRSGAQVIPLRSRRASRLLIGIAAAAAVAALGAGGYAVNTHQQLIQTSAAQADAARQRHVTQQETDILQAPDASLYASRLQDGSSVTYLVSKSRNAAMMISGDLVDPGSGKTYQLWTLVRNAAGGVDYVPDHTFGAGTNQRVVLTGDVTSALGVAITIEPSGGSLQPSAEPDARATF